MLKNGEGKVWSETVAEKLPKYVISSLLKKICFPLCVWNVKICHDFYSPRCGLHKMNEEMLF